MRDFDKDNDHDQVVVPYSIIGTLFIYSVFTLVIGLSAYWVTNDYDRYYLSLQEDGFIEWMTFWAFIAGGFLFIINAKKLRRTKGWAWVWFMAVLSLFCFVVAMEEISWGQRFIGYMPPEYFLENNYQQEFNFHNLLETNLRKAGLKLVIVGYGIILPLLALISKTRPILFKCGITPPPFLFVPAFISIYILFEIYPFKFTGEIVELLLGLGFMYSALAIKRNFERGKIYNRIYDLKVLIISTGIVGGLGILNSYVSKNSAIEDKNKIEMARKEVKSLQNDFINIITGKYGTRIPTCGKHLRIYTYFDGYKDIEKASTTGFHSLIGDGLSEERAEFYMDPWSLPYWIKDFCTADGKRMISVYSFGPDRQRQSSDTEIKGDDIGLINVVEM